VRSCVEPAHGRYDDVEAEVRTLDNLKRVFERRPAAS